MKHIHTLVITIATVLITQAQIRISNSAALLNAPSSSAFIDASSTAPYSLDGNNLGKGLLFPSVDLSKFTKFGGGPFGGTTSYSSFYDGMIVYNTNVGDVVGGSGAAGHTDGTLTYGYWYYDNPKIEGQTRTVSTGIWKSLSASGGDSKIIINEGAENVTNIIIDGHPVYSYKGKFQMGPGFNTTARITLTDLPTGVKTATGVYSVTIFQGVGSGKQYYANGVYSLDLANSTLVTGSPNISNRYPDGTYEYIIEYFKP